nr:uncharacterized protein CTRU02_03172 [Colletotrichum truncatum]KAF6797141.1 hypothetical protein CTRU02_03172 [Colletotrichum truncatum]
MEGLLMGRHHDFEMGATAEPRTAALCLDARCQLQVVSLEPEHPPCPVQFVVVVGMSEDDGCGGGMSRQGKPTHALSMSRAGATFVS